MKQVLCIVGPTATGKTALAIKLAKNFDGILISADSRQVYRGMNIVTGKDQPSNVSIHGIDIFRPDQESSVAGWFGAVKGALDSKHLPVVVGGTGLYVHAVTSGIPTIDIPPNRRLRRELEKYSKNELVTRLGELDAPRLASMNESDRANPRRLIRAIELALVPRKLAHYPAYDSLIVGLQPKIEDYAQIIRKRVIIRLDLGAIEETQTLLDNYSPSLPSMTALGYKHILKYLKRDLSREAMITAWVQDELAYAKRQITWFKKIPGILWFDSHDPGLNTQVADLVKSWYHSS